MNKVRALIVVSLLVFGASSWLLWNDGVTRFEGFEQGHTRLMEDTDKTPLTAYISCVLRPRCLEIYREEINVGKPFPMLLAMLWLFSGGLAAVGLFRKLPQRLYEGSMAVLKDVKDLRVNNWLSDKRSETSIVVGHHIEVPKSGEERKAVLRGHLEKGYDKAMLVVRPGYGKRPELPLVTTFGTTRSGKTQHLIAQSLRWSGSFIALDVKGEIYSLTAGVKAQQGRIFVLSPHGRGHQFDAVGELMSDAEGAATAAAIIAAPHKEKGDSMFFAEKAAQGLVAAFYAAKLEGVAPFDLLYDVGLKGGLGSFVERLRRHDDPGVRLALNGFLDPHGGDDFDLQRILSDKGMTAVYSTMTTRLKPFLTPNVRYLLRRSDFKPRHLMERNLYIYLQFDEGNLKATQPVYDLVVTSLLQGMIKYFDANIRTRKQKAAVRRVMVMLDELAAAPVWNLPNVYASAAGRHITPMLYCQAPSQLEGLYGIDGRKTILANTGVKLFYKSDDPEMNVYISQLAGKVSRQEVRRTRRWRMVPEAPTISEGNQSREVITPDEVDMVGGEDREVFLAKVTGKPLMLLKRVVPHADERISALMNAFPAPPIKQAGDSDFYHGTNEQPSTNTNPRPGYTNEEVEAATAYAPGGVKEAVASDARPPKQTLKVGRKKQDEPVQPPPRVAVVRTQDSQVLNRIREIKEGSEQPQPPLFGEEATDIQPSPSKFLQASREALASREKEG